jgi:hypothetical protein
VATIGSTGSAPIFFQDLLMLGRERRGIRFRAWQIREDFACDVALEAADDLAFGQSFGGTAFDVGAGGFVVAYAHDGHDVERAVGGSVAAAAESVPAVVRPLLAGCGATPQSLAKAASLWMRSGLSPAVTRNCPASSTPTPNRSTRSGEPHRRPAIRNRQ